MKIINSKLSSIIREYKDTSPSRDETFNIALELEQSVGELHYQKFMDEDHDLEINEVLKKLNRDDKDHSIRIRSYMEKHDISIREFS